MNGARITFLDSQEIALCDYLDSHPEGHERAAIVLFRRLHACVDRLAESDRYLAVEVIPFREEWITTSSPSHIGFELKFLRDLFRRCEEKSLVFGFVHNHPTGFLGFSDTDEENERTLLDALRNRNGHMIHFVAMLWTNRRWLARVRQGTAPGDSQPIRHIVVLGWPLRMHGYAQSNLMDEALLARQAAAFGQPFVDKLQSLRIGVVGAGGTGSPTIALLARAGVGELVVVDQDKLERSNLNRVRGAGSHDVGKNKARIAQSFIHSLGLPTSVAVFESLIDEDPLAVDALASCDVVFGCTDDQIGRELLSAALYIYAMPYIDVGLGGQVIEDHEGQSNLRYHFGRVSTVLPESGECLFCQGVIRDLWIRREYALRENPAMSGAEARERYLEGGGEQAPGVGPFTGGIADCGVATLFDLIKPYRRLPPELRRDSFRVDFVTMEFRSSQEKNDQNCPYCGTREYLLLAEKYRLNRPKLGQKSVAL